MAISPQKQTITLIQQQTPTISYHPLPLRNPITKVPLATAAGNLFYPLILGSLTMMNPSEKVFQSPFAAIGYVNDNFLHDQFVHLEPLALRIIEHAVLLV